jgi:hypothetical protein
MGIMGHIRRYLSTNIRISYNRFQYMIICKIMIREAKMLAKKGLSGYSTT